jgi:hypothetical protein
MISIQVLFDVSRNVDTLLESNDGSAMVRCLVDHDSRSAKLLFSSAFTFSKGVPCVDSSTGVKV